MRTRSKGHERTRRDHATELIQDYVEAIAEIETAKAVEELESPVDGTVRELLVPAGATVPVREPIAIVD